MCLFQPSISTYSTITCQSLWQMSNLLCHLRILSNAPRAWPRTCKDNASSRMCSKSQQWQAKSTTLTCMKWTLALALRIELNMAAHIFDKHKNLLNRSKSSVLMMTLWYEREGADPCESSGHWREASTDSLLIAFWYLQADHPFEVWLSHITIRQHSRGTSSSFHKTFEKQWWIYKKLTQK